MINVTTWTSHTNVRNFSQSHNPALTLLGYLLRCSRSPTFLIVRLSLLAWERGMARRVFDDDVWLVSKKKASLVSVHRCYYGRRFLPTLHTTTPLSMNRLFATEVTLAKVRLGPLERKILEEFWSHDSLTVRELLEDGKIQLAYTTVMTTLDRLFKKGLLERSEEGRAFRYSATCAPEEVQRLVAVSGVRRWIESNHPSSLPLSYFVEAVGAHDGLLAELRVLVEQKRSELKKRKGKQP